MVFGKVRPVQVQNITRVRGQILFRCTGLSAFFCFILLLKCLAVMHNSQASDVRTSWQ